MRSVWLRLPDGHHLMERYPRIIGCVCHLLDDKEEWFNKSGDKWYNSIQTDVDFDYSLSYWKDRIGFVECSEDEAKEFLCVI